jgi:hypothetical protein
MLLKELADNHAAEMRHSLRLATATFSAEHPTVKILRLRVERAEGARRALAEDMAEPA